MSSVAVAYFYHFLVHVVIVHFCTFLGTFLDDCLAKLLRDYMHKSHS